MKKLLICLLLCNTVFAVDLEKSENTDEFTGQTTSQCKKLDTKPNRDFVILDLVSFTKKNNGSLYFSWTEASKVFLRLTPESRKLNFYCPSNGYRSELSPTEYTSEVTEDYSIVTETSTYSLSSYDTEQMKSCTGELKVRYGTTVKSFTNLSCLSEK